MPPKEYQFTLSSEAYGTAYFLTDRGTVLEFVVKLHFQRGETTYEVLRFDTALGGPHKDVLLPSGTKHHVKTFHYLDNNQALTFAIDDIFEHWQLYIERFQQWLEENKKK